MDDPAKLYSIGEAAKRLGIPASRLRYWSDRGYVPSIRTPTKYRYFTADALDALAAEINQPIAVRLPSARHTDEPDNEGNDS